MNFGFGDAKGQALALLVPAFQNIAEFTGQRLTGTGRQTDFGQLEEVVHLLRYGFDGFDDGRYARRLRSTRRLDEQLRLGRCSRRRRQSRVSHLRRFIGQFFRFCNKIKPKMEVTDSSKYLLARSMTKHWANCRLLLRSGL